MKASVRCQTEGESDTMNSTDPEVTRSLRAIEDHLRSIKIELEIGGAFIALVLGVFLYRALGW